MNAEVFVDTNDFLYSISDQPEEQAKAELARSLLLSENWAGRFRSQANSSTQLLLPNVSFVLPQIKPLNT